jgi:cytochrome c oxidase subunit II
LSGRPSSHPSRVEIFRRVAGAIVVAAAICGCGREDHPMTTLAPKSDLAAWIYALFLQVSAWDALIFAIVLTALALALFRFSTRVGEAAPRAPAAADLRLEVAWTIGPALVLLFISIPTVRTIFRSQPPIAPADALVIKVVAHQWWWQFDYPDGGISTANELHVPLDRPVMLRLESGDVIHSFWVPPLGGKRDVVPGQVNELTFVAREKGEYFGQCAEFCGLSHANMRFRVFVDTPEQFAAWKRDQLGPPIAVASGAAAGGAAYFANSPCTTCHTIAGISKGRTGPDLTHFASRTTLAAGVLPNTPDKVAQWIEDPARLKPGAQMPALGLRGKPVDDLVAYLESLR